VLVLTTVILFTMTMARAIVPLVAGNFVSIDANQANTNQAKSNYGVSPIDPGNTDFRLICTIRKFKSKFRIFGRLIYYLGSIVFFYNKEQLRIC
jgi:hypothetical protein